MSTFRYPVGAANGKLLLSDSPVAEAIRQAIQTRYGERVFRNTYGSDVEEFSLVTDLDRILAELTEGIIDSTEDYQPLSINLAGYIDDDGYCQISVEYDDGTGTQDLNIQL
jgi:hypothetical protein